jgi:Spy/CpxP family protein refolding chaperone
MRILGTLALALAAGLLLVNLATGQRPGGPPGKGGAGGPATDPASLLHMLSVQKELKLTDDQVKKVDEAFAKAMGGVLDADQLKRLSQIQLQLHGSKVFFDPKIQTALKITAEQEAKIKTILDESAKEVKELLKEMKPNDTMRKVNVLKKEADEKINNVLTDGQKKEWQEMVGAAFRLGGGGMKGKGKDKDKKPGS